MTRDLHNIGGRLVLGRASLPNSTNKYRAIKTTVDGYEFHSRREAERYLILRQLQKDGIITDLKLQVPFVLIPSQIICGQKQQGVTYKADFTYTEDGRLVVEDSKGFSTKEYRIKRKLMKFIHNIEVVES